MAKSKANEEKVKFIITFITEHRDEFTRCADAHKAFMAEHGKVSYVHFNRKFRELCPHLKPKKKVRALRPIQVVADPPQKNQDLKDKKRELNHYHQVLRDSEALLQEAIETKADEERINYYRDIRDRDRKAIVDCYELLLAYYEEKISSDVKEIDLQLQEEAVRNGIEVERMLANRSNVLINESDEEEDSTSEKHDLDEVVPSTLDEAADIMSLKSKTKKNNAPLEQIAVFPEEEGMRG